MARSLPWPLVLAWLLVGAAAGVALSDAFSSWILLLVPAVLAAAWLLWNTGPGREAAAALVGLGSGPLLLAQHGRYPDCPIDGFSTRCEATSLWPWLLVAAILVAGGVVLLLVQPRHTPTQ